MAYTSNGTWDITTGGADTAKRVSELRTMPSGSITCSIDGTIDVGIQISAKPDVASSWVTVYSLSSAGVRSINVYPGDSYQLRPNVTSGTSGSFYAR